MCKRQVQAGQTHHNLNRVERSSRADRGCRLWFLLAPFDNEHGDVQSGERSSGDEQGCDHSSGDKHGVE
ncbi:unnamed protein product [Sphagnum balticum]